MCLYFLYLYFIFVDIVCKGWFLGFFGLGLLSFDFFVVISFVQDHLLQIGP